MRLLSFDLDLIRKHGEPELYEQFCNLNPMLQAVYFWAAAFAYTRFRKQLLITSIERENAGVHSCHRGLDVDVDEYAKYGGLLTAEAMLLRDEIERRFAYDAGRPQYRVALFGADDPHGKHWNHIHMQVCHSGLTRLRGGDIIA